ncbi:MAG: hypothetical protein AB1585_03125 [Thermodesulfobacteriota bacterium]
MKQLVALWRGDVGGWKTLILALAVLLLVLTSCASTLTIRPDGSMVAKDYTVTIRKDGTKIYTPNRWFNTNFITKVVADFLGLVTK